MSEQTYSELYLDFPPAGVSGNRLTRVGDRVAVEWVGDSRTIDDLMVWHDCGFVLGPESVAPGMRFGWRPSGVRAHTLVQVDPLTITASVYWPDCCGLHGFITDDVWHDA